MSKEQTRKLAAILFADIAGYTALMQHNEPLARKGLTLFRETLSRLVAKHEGNIVNFYGDGCLCLFDSSVQAVQCAHAAQLVFLAADPVLPVRIGLHSGDMFMEQDNAYGNSINVASRIESVSIPGAVLLSERIKRDINNQPQFPLASLGVQHFKNVDEPVTIYALAADGLAIPDKNKLSGKLAQPLTNRRQKLLRNSGLGILGLLLIFFVVRQFAGSTEATPAELSIAVLPFTNFSDDKDQEYFSTGISHDILDNLSQINTLKVIDFNSSKLYFQSEKTNQQIGKELGVAHLLVGNVQRAGEQVRVRAQLVKTQENQQIWGNSYDFYLQDIFKIQSEVARTIAKELRAKLSESETARLNKSPTTNLAVYEQFSKGRYHWIQRGSKNLKLALLFYQKSVELDTTFAQGYAGLAQTHVTMASNSMDDWVQHYRWARQFAEMALQLDPHQSDALAALGNYYSDYERNYEASIEALQEAIKINPKNATAHQWLAETLLTKGDIPQARQAIDIAKYLSPVYPAIQLVDGQILLAEGKIEEAIAHFRKMEEEYPRYGPSKRALLYGLLRAGDFEGARALMDGIRSQLGKLIYGIHYHKELRNRDSLLVIRDSLQAIKNRDPRDPFEDLFLSIDNYLALLDGDTDKYLDGLELAFEKYYSGPGHFQYFPLPDTIWQHQKWQDMMKRIGFYAPPRSYTQIAGD